MSEIPCRPGLADPFLKCCRAKEHLEALQLEINRFQQSKPYSIIRQDDFERGKHLIKVDIENTPDKINVILGDLCYCLRSALDQTVWYLAKLTVARPDRTEFPVLDKWNSEARRQFKRSLQGVPIEAIAIIKDLQPCNRPDVDSMSEDPLWRLNALCNIDKHRRIPVHGLVGDFYWPKSPPGGLVADFDHENDAMRIPLAHKPYTALEPDVTIQIMFGDLSEGLSLDVVAVERMYNCVADGVIPKFARFFQ